MVRQSSQVVVYSESNATRERIIGYLHEIRDAREIPDFDIKIMELIDELEEGGFDILVIVVQDGSPQTERILNYLQELDEHTSVLLITSTKMLPHMKIMAREKRAFYIMLQDCLACDVLDNMLAQMIREHDYHAVLEEQHRAHESLLKNIPGMAYRCRNDEQWTMLYMSDGCRDLTGYEPEQIINNKELAYNDLIHPEDRNRVHDLIQTAIEKKEHYSIAYRINTSRREEKWVLEMGNIYQSLDGDWLLEGFITDITERVAAQEALLQSQQHLQNIYDSVSIGLGIIEGSTITEANGYLCDLLGYSRAELINADLASFIITDDAQARKDIPVILDKKTNIVDSQRARLRKKDGEEVDVILTTSRIFADTKSPISFAVFDISQQIELYTLLQESEEKSRSIIEHMHEGVVLIDEDGIVVEWNEALEDIVPIPRSEVLRGSFLALLDRVIEEEIIRESHEDGRRFLSELFRNHKESFLDRFWEGEIRNSKGEYHFCHADFFTIHTPAGNRMAVIIRDIDAQKHHEKELQFLVDLSAAIRKTPNDVEEIRRAVLDILMNLLGAYGIALAVFDNNSDEGIITEVRGIAEERIGRHVYWHECVKQSPIFYDSVYAICEECTKQLFGEDEISKLHTRISIPLISGNNRIGIIFLTHEQKFSEYEFGLMEAVSNIVANAMNQAIQYHNTEIRLKRLESLHVVDQAISGLFNIDLTNRIILDQAKQQLSADGGDILILNRATNMLEYSARFGLKPLERVEQRVYLSHSIAGQVLLSREACIEPDLTHKELPFIMEHLQNNDFKAYFAYPLVAKGEPKGVIEIYMKEPFTPDSEWMSFLKSLATQAGIAIDNIQLVEKLKRLQYE